MQRFLLRTTISLVTVPGNVHTTTEKDKGQEQLDATVSVINNRGQLGGITNLAGDVTTHPFLWSHGSLTDLRTLGGRTEN